MGRCSCLRGPLGVPGNEGSSGSTPNLGQRQATYADTATWLGLS
jgi:hypothetical protein